MFASVHHILRLISVFRTLARHRAWHPLEQIENPPFIIRFILVLARLTALFSKKSNGSAGERLARALKDLGPAYIKLGQTLATRPDLVGLEIAEDLTSLQDRLPPFPTEKARATIEQEFNTSIDDLFAAFDDDPVAAASIAQVHWATTRDGRDVAVKVLRPDVEKAFARDLDTFLWLARLAERRRPAMRRLRPVAMVRTLAESVRAEMDLRLEAAAASELQENMMGERGYRIPAIDWQRTSRRVLTIERVRGIRLSGRKAFEAIPYGKAGLAATIIRVFLLQAMRDGFFHADLHQGNLIIEEDGTLAAIDFGIMGRLDRKTRHFLAETLWGFLERDYHRVAEIHFEVGYIPKDQSVYRFAQALRSIGEPILGRPANEISFGRLFAQLLATTETFSMQTQPHLLILQRTMVMAEGLALQLDPGANMWELSRPVIESWIREELGPEAKLADSIHNVIRFAGLLPELAEKAEQILTEFDPEKQKEQPDNVPAQTSRATLIASFLSGALIAVLLTVWLTG